MRPRPARTLTEQQAQALDLWRPCGQALPAVGQHGQRQNRGLYLRQGQKPWTTGQQVLMMVPEINLTPNWKSPGGGARFAGPPHRVAAQRFDAGPAFAQLVDGAHGAMPTWCWGRAVGVHAHAAFGV